MGRHWPLKHVATAVLVWAALFAGCGPKSPTITTHPADQAVAVGETATFSVVATGSGPITYQWRKDGVDIPGATGSSYTTPPAALADDGAQFTCVVSNEAGSTMSDAGVIVMTPPSITTDPAAQTVTEGETATFTVVATGSGKLAYQWQKNTVDIAGATDSSYTTPATTLADDGAQFTCVVSNVAGSVTSSPATLTVNMAPPKITMHPSDQTVGGGDAATFTVTATGSELTFQWRRSDDGGSTWTDIPGATASTYTTPPTALADDGAQFTCVATNAVDSVESDPATLTVVIRPVWSWGRNEYGQLGDDTTTDRHTPAHVLGPYGADYLTGVAAIAAEGRHTVILKEDGTVRAWGDNEAGQLGDGTTTNGHLLVQVLGLGGSGYLTDVQAIAAGGAHTVALKTDGTVWAWGENYWGQLGQVDNTDRHTPVQVLGPGGSGYLTDVQAIAAGGSHTVALKTDGTVWDWGRNEDGELGIGPGATRKHFPVQVLGPGGSGYLTEVAAIAAAGAHTVALKTDGTVWAWGSNYYGELGDGTTTDGYTPVQVLGPGGSGYLTEVAAIAAGYGYSVALKSDGIVWAWGANGYGQLGDGTTTHRHTPVQVLSPGGSSVQAIAAGGYHTVALKTDGAVWAWGRNDYYQLGDDTTADRQAPVQVLGPGGSGYLTDVQAIAAGAQHTIALRSDGTVRAWGHNDKGQLGDGTWTDRRTPVQVLGPGGLGYFMGASAIAAGDDHTVALKSNGTVWTWGYGPRTPVQVLGPGGVGYFAGVAAIAAGNEHSVALKSDGTVWAWGANGNGQLGDGTTDPGTYSRTPIKVLGPGGSGYLTDVQAIAAGGSHTVAVKSDGTAWAWGWNGWAQLGDGTTTNSYTPVQVLGPGGSGYLTGAATVAAGVVHTVILKSDGTVWAWGDNSYGQLGDGTATRRYAPVQVVGSGGVGYLTGVAAIAAGGYHTIALKSDGTVRAWGRNIRGQLGDGTTIGRSWLVQTLGPGGSGYLTSVAAIAAGRYHTVAVKSDGTVWAWGYNVCGQLGDGTTAERHTPVQVLGPGGSGYLTGVAGVAAGASFTLAW